MRDLAGQAPHFRRATLPAAVFTHLGAAGAARRLDLRGAARSFRPQSLLTAIPANRSCEARLRCLSFLSMPDCIFKKY